MRWFNDQLLAENVSEIDLFLGGHDHDYVVNKINEKWVLKSGTDFREFSYISMSIDKEKYDSLSANSNVKKILKFIVDSKIEESLEIKNLVDHYLGI
jgi:5'-nucleotidase